MRAKASLGRRTPGYPLSLRPLVGAAVFVGAVLILTALLPNSVGANERAEAGVGSSLLPTLVLTDNSLLSTVFGLGTVKISDGVHLLPPSSGVRSYDLVIGVVAPISSLSATVETNPLLQWSNPMQKPGGADNLPPFQLWTWSVTTGGVNDTANWTVMAYSHFLKRTVGWADQTFVIRGTTQPVEPVTVPATLPTGDSTPQVGLFLQYPGAPNSSIPTTNPAYRSLITSLDPGMIRLSLSGIQTYAYWSKVTLSPVFNFTAFDASVNFSNAVGATVVLSLPVGTWGDGNFLPYGMPVNTSMPLTFLGNTGYFPTAASYQRFVDVLVAHVVAYHETIPYWSIGNEQPLPNATIAGMFVKMFNVAEKEIHAQLPRARVGSDVLTNRTFLPQFSTTMHNVGFLSYHFYPAVGYCVANGTFCPPAGGFNGTVDPNLFRPIAELYGDSVFYAPHLAQELWYNATHNWLPVFDAESNLNAVGGAHTSWVGTDARDQSLFGAAWLVAALLQSASENVSSLTYFTATDPSNSFPTTITSPYGGWGFGLARPGPVTGYLHYAPYWALKLWANNVPAGSRGAVLPTNDRTVLQAYADQSASGLNVILVNLAAVPVQVPVTLSASGYVSHATHILDSRSYVQTFNASSQREHLWRSGVTQNISKVPSLTVTIDGYGVAVVQFVKSTGKGPMIASNNSSASALCVAASGLPTNVAADQVDNDALGVWATPPFGVASLIAARSVPA
ncbi:MAG: hypothetical protein L3K05_01040 [Thermoplasmata archaeon]|nr:hypothetical protein [Thermoplasmata archaeon]